MSKLDTEDKLYQTLKNAKELILNILQLELTRNNTEYRNRIRYIIDLIKDDYLTIRKHTRMKRDLTYLTYKSPSLYTSLANLKALAIINNVKELVLTNIVSKITIETNSHIINIIHGIVINTYSIEFSKVFL
jgi:hypothetical protein